MQQNFVIFLSPGTMFSEETMKPIDTWDIDEAVEMSRNVLERYNATPYGFYFITKSRNDNDLDSKETARSNFYYLGGNIISLGELKIKNDPNDRILIQNMESNHWDAIVENTNSWKVVQPLRETDVILEYK